MARSQGNAPLLALTTFLGLMFVACLILAIVFYLQVADATQRADRATTDLRAVADSRDLNEPAIEVLRQEPGTVVRLLLTENQELKQLILAESDADLAQINKEANALREGSSLLKRIEGLNAEVQAAVTQQQEAQRARDEANDRADAAERARDTIRNEFNQSIQEARAEAESQKEAAESMRSGLDDVESDLKAQLASFRTQETRSLQERDALINELERDNRNLRDELETRKLTGQYAKAITEPDARIIAVPTDDDKIYINVGAQDRVVAGMTFEVFRSGELIGLEHFNEVRGVGTIEVITTEARTSAARVVRLAKGEDVREGDVLVNLVYDPQADLKFHVFGRFDIDNIGEATTADRRRVESMVERWGGVTVEDFSADVDFLVLGQRPEAPAQLPPGTTNPQLIQQQVREQRAYDNWQNLEGLAQRSGVPVLNENRFLGLIGYYQR